MDDNQAGQDPYHQTLERVCAYYQDLQACALQVMSPRRDGLRAWLTSYVVKGPPKTRNILVRFADWYFRHVFALFATPLRASAREKKSSPGHGYLAVTGLLLYTLSLITCLLLLLFIRYRGAGGQGTQSSLGFDALLFLLSVAVMLFFVPANYIRLYYLITNRPRTKYHPYILWGYVGLLAIFLISPFWPGASNWFDLFSTAPAAAWQHWAALFETSPFLLFMVFIWFIIPAYTQIYATLVELIVLLVWSIWLIIDALRFFHTPMPIQTIKELARREIPGRSGTWRLRDLSLADITLLREWAADNRESTDKRLIPSILLISILQFVGWNTIVGLLLKVNLPGFVADILRGIFSSNYLAVLWALMLFVALVLCVQLLFIPVRGFFSLIKNLLTQSIILETCLVAEYARKQTLAAENGFVKPGDTPKKPGFLAAFLSKFR
jgi:hypothetical protein